MYRWTEKSVRWYAEAVAFTGVDRALAERLTPYLPRGETVCDLGCGIGFLAMELARRGYETTAVDHDPEAMAWLRTRREQLGLENLRPLERSWDELSGEAWDNVIMVSAGGGGHDPEFYRRLCRKRLIVVDRAKLTSHVRPEGRPSARRDSLYDWESGASVRVDFTLEFGQPFRSVEEAREYIEFMGGSEVEETLKALQKTDSPDFPLYLPYSKEMELRVFDITESCAL